jgi:hypothetical protein
MVNGRFMRFRADSALARKQSARLKKTFAFSNGYGVTQPLSTGLEIDRIAAAAEVLRNRFARPENSVLRRNHLFA